MNFEAVSDNVKGLLTSTRTYRIPRFQRDFSWEQSNYNEFLNDMISQIGYCEEHDDYVNSQYFLGNMLFLGKKEDDLVDVVDGQQRITSITILLSAIRNTLYNITDKDIYSDADIQSAKDYADTIHNEYLIKKIDGVPQRKVETTSSFPYFTQTIQDYATSNSEVEPSTEEEELLKKAFDFFKKQLDKEFLLKKLSDSLGQKFKETHYIKILKALRDQILKAQIIEVFVAERDQANKIFENINSKGKPLSQVDLIKNSIFSKINVTGAGIDEIAMTWSAFGKRVMNLDTTFDEFFLHFWKAEFPFDQATGTNLYKKFLDRFATEDQVGLEQFVKKIEIALNLYVSILSPDLNHFKRQEQKPEYEYLEAINRFKGVQVRPALLAFYMANHKMGNDGKKVLQRKKRNDFLRMLSTFHFAAFGTNLKIRSNIVTKPYRNFIEIVHKAKNREDLQKAINNLKGELFGLISKDKFIQAFSELRFTKKLTPGDAESFPASYAVKQVANFFENREYNDDQYSIEHVYDESSGYTNIGNLTVLENNKNNKINVIKQKSNNEITYLDKLPIYRESKYVMVSKLCVDYPNFSDKDISKRAKELGNIYWEAYFN